MQILIFGEGEKSKNYLKNILLHRAISDEGIRAIIKNRYKNIHVKFRDVFAKNQGHKKYH